MRALCIISTPYFGEYVMIYTYIHTYINQLQLLDFLFFFLSWKRKRESADIVLQLKKRNYTINKLVLYIDRIF